MKNNSTVKLSGTKPRAVTTLLSCLISVAALAQPTNDNASGAISLVVGPSCGGSGYSNVNATHTPGEPYANCNNESTGDHSVWFSFSAPPNGVVKITTDNGTAGTLNDTKIGLFEATNASDYSTFHLIACDEDNGVDNGTTDLLSTIFATGLIPGTTYYIQVDGRTSTATGSFCIQVQEMNPGMLPGAAACAAVQNPVGNNPAYTGWVTLVDVTGKVVALVRNNSGGAPGAYSGSYHINANGFVPPRQSLSGISYLNRNFAINSSSGTTAVDVQFFFHPGEVITYNGGNIGTLNVTQQTGTVCNADFVEGNAATSFLPQTGNGDIYGGGWIQVSASVPGNFYLMDGSVPLPISLTHIDAANEGSQNKITWTTVQEGQGEYFELERSSDSKNFSFQARVAGQGKAAGYTYRDLAALKGTSYYRLKMSNNDGQATYSKVVSATMADKSVFSLKAVPNPVNGMLKVAAIGGSAGANIVLCDITGKTLSTYHTNGEGVNIDMSSMAKGVYLIRYHDGLRTEVLKISKQ